MIIKELVELRDAFLSAGAVVQASAVEEAIEVVRRNLEAYLWRIELPIGSLGHYKIVGYYVDREKAEDEARQIGGAAFPTSPEGVAQHLRVLLKSRSELTFNEFSVLSVPTKTPDAPLLLWAAGLGGENAEVATAMLDLISLMVAGGNASDAAKKLERSELSGFEDPVDRDAELVNECGDSLFYLDKLLARRGRTLEDAARALIAKLDHMRPKKIEFAEGWDAPPTEEELAATVDRWKDVLSGKHRPQRWQDGIGALDADKESNANPYSDQDAQDSGDMFEGQS